MTITLYKNCICSHEYKEVFHYSIFETYLNTLSKLTISDISLVYQEGNGIFNFEYNMSPTSNIYEYNYMKVVSTNGETTITRYCFIKNIKLRNDCVIVSYEEDLWQSYSAGINLRQSYLSRSKLLKYIVNEDLMTYNNIEIYHLPIEYQSHDALINTEISTFSDEYYVILQVQMYDAKEYGEATQRKAFTTFLYRMNWDRESNNLDMYCKFSMDGAIKYINKLYLMTQYKWTDDLYISIANITLVPCRLFEQGAGSFVENFYPSFGTCLVSDLNQHFKSNDYYNSKLIEIGESWYFSLPELIDTKASSICNGKHFIKNFTLQNNFNAISIGTMTNQFEIIPNGRDYSINIYVEMNTYNFDIYLEFDCKQVAITNDFVLDIPFTVMNGEALAQQKMSRTIRNIKAVGNIVEGAASMGIAGGIAYKNHQLQALNRTKTNRSKRSRSVDYMNTKIDLDLANTEIGGANGIIGGIADLIEINAPVYSSTEGTFTYDDGILNAYYGILVKTISPQNSTLVLQMINETGYITYHFGQNEYLKNYKTLSPNIDYNILKFEFVKMYGSFSQDICDKLKNILLNGFKIWYTENV